MPSPKISLYDCYNARVMEDGIPENILDYKVFCAAGHCLLANSVDCSVSYRRVARGEPLCLTPCQGCIDYEPMGGKLLPEERGWITTGRIGRRKVSK